MKNMYWLLEVTSDDNIKSLSKDEINDLCFQLGHAVGRKDTSIYLFRLSDYRRELMNKFLENLYDNLSRRNDCSPCFSKKYKTVFDSLGYAIAKRTCEAINNHSYDGRYCISFKVISREDYKTIFDNYSNMTINKNGKVDTRDRIGFFVTSKDFMELFKLVESNFNDITCDDNIVKSLLLCSKDGKTVTKEALANWLPKVLVNLDYFDVIIDKNDLYNIILSLVSKKLKCFSNEKFNFVRNELFYDAINKKDYSLGELRKLNISNYDFDYDYYVEEISKYIKEKITTFCNLYLNNCDEFLEMLCNMLNKYISENNISISDNMTAIEFNTIYFSDPKFNSLKFLEYAKVNGNVSKLLVDYKEKAKTWCSKELTFSDVLLEKSALDYVKGNENKGYRESFDGFSTELDRDKFFATTMAEEALLPCFANRGLPLEDMINSFNDGYKMIIFKEIYALRKKFITNEDAVHLNALLNKMVMVRLIKPGEKQLVVNVLCKMENEYKRDNEKGYTRK